MSENIEEIDQKEEIINLYPPQPLTFEEFSTNIVNLIFSKLDEEEFAETFGFLKNDEQLAQNMDSPKFLGILNEKIIFFTEVFCDDINTLVLNGDINKAYNKLIELAAFSPQDMEYIAYTKTEQTAYLEDKFSKIEVWAKQLDFVNNITVVSVSPAINNPANISRKIMSYEDNLSEENKAKMYITCAQAFQSSMYTPLGSVVPEIANAQKDFLEKAIDATSNLQTLEECQSYISANPYYKNDRNLKNAYKRIIEKAKKEKNHKILYIANKNLGKIYQKAGHAIGYKTPNSPATISLKKAEIYYADAIKAGKKIKKTNLIGDLKELSKIQTLNGNKIGLGKTQINMAKLLNGKDKYEVLIAAIPNLNEKIEHINMLSLKIPRAKMPTNDKIILIKKLELSIKNNISNNGEKLLAKKHINNAKSLLSQTPTNKERDY